jgi:hypothetical protein
MNTTYSGGNVREIAENKINYNPDLHSGEAPADLSKPIEIKFEIPPEVLAPETPAVYASGVDYAQGDPIFCNALRLQNEFYHYRGKLSIIKWKKKCRYYIIRLSHNGLDRFAPIMPDHV